MRKLKKLRTEHKLSTRQLAEKLDISQAHISKMESNKNLPSLPMLEKIAETFSVHITYFFNHEKVDTNIEGAEFVAVEENKVLSADDMKNIFEFVKDAQNGKFDLSKIQNIILKE